MSLQTKQETIYSAALRTVLEESNEASWLKMLRENAIDQFEQIGFPTVKQEEWKYTNIATFVASEFDVKPTPTSNQSGVHVDAFLPEAEKSELTFENGVFQPDLSSTEALSECFVATNLNEVLANEKYAAVLREHFARLVKPETNGFTALNTAFASHGAFIFVPKNTKIDAPIHLLFYSSERAAQFATFPRVFIYVERGAEATVVEHYNADETAKYMTNAVAEIVVEEDARLKHFCIQRESQTALHVRTTNTQIHRASLYDTTNITLGAALSRHDIALSFNQQAAECYVDGLYILSDAQHHDTHSTINHLVPNCVSHQTYKGVLNHKSRAVFNGKVFVEVGASGTDGYQSNKNLLLSNEARVDTKPQLEIFNDDVKCSHGATVGQFEEEELFYLISRGLSPALAKNLLTYGFAESLISKIEIESIKKQLDEAVLNRLDAKF